jgi:hypothetical protein
MIDSTALARRSDECAAWPVELVVESDGCGEAEEALQDALSEALQDARAVALEGEQVLAGAEDALDTLTDRREVRTGAGLVLAPRAEDRRVQRLDAGGEPSADVPLSPMIVSPPAGTTDAAAGRACA